MRDSPEMVVCVSTPLCSMGFSYDSEKRSTRAFSTSRNAGRFIAHTNSTQTRPDGYGFEPILTKHDFLLRLGWCRCLSGLWSN